MSKLQDWIEEHLETINCDTMDISKNDEAREALFSQLEDLDFDFKRTDSPDEYMISVRLMFPYKSKKPYDILFDTKKMVLVPQYTESHCVYRPSKGSLEYDILSGVSVYVKTNKPTNEKKKSYYVPVSEDKEYVTTAVGEPIPDGVKFCIHGWWSEDGVDKLDGRVTIYYDNDLSKIIASQDEDTKGFYVLPAYEMISFAIRKVPKLNYIEVYLRGQSKYPEMDFRKLKAIASY